MNIWKPFILILGIFASGGEAGRNCNSINFVAGLNSRSGKGNYQSLGDGIACAPRNDVFVVKCSKFGDLFGLCKNYFTFDDAGPTGCFGPLGPNTFNPMCSMNNMEIPMEDKCKRQIINIGKNGGFNNIEDVKKEECIRNDGNYYWVKRASKNVNSKGESQTR